ncbi:MAG: hypothetical protein ABMA14_09825 [Hyphomonadaceae bacterium]
MDYCVRVSSKDFHAIKAETLKLPEDHSSEFKSDVEAQYRVGDFAWFVCVDKRDATYLAKKWKGIPVAKPGDMVSL